MSDVEKLLREGMDAFAAARAVSDETWAQILAQIRYRDVE